MLYIFQYNHTSLWSSAATVFGQNLRIEPLNPEKKALWKREMDCLLSVCDFIVEFSPILQDLDDGTTVEVKIFRYIWPFCFFVFCFSFFFFFFFLLLFNVSSWCLLGDGEYTKIRYLYEPSCIAKAWHDAHSKTTFIC